MKISAWVFIAIIVLSSVVSDAREGDSVSLSVQEVAIQDTIAVKLGGKAQWALALRMWRAGSRSLRPATQVNQLSCRLRSLSCS